MSHCRNPTCTALAARVLYLLSTDPTLRGQLATVLTPVVPMLVDLLVNTPGGLVDPEFAALLVNLALSPALAECMVARDGLVHMLKRLQQTQDLFLLKLVRNISEIQSAKEVLARFLFDLASTFHHVNDSISSFLKYSFLVPFISTSFSLLSFFHFFSSFTFFLPSFFFLLDMVLKAPTPDFRIEALGTLANVSLPKVRYSDVLARMPLLEFIYRNLERSHADDDVALQVVILIGTFAVDPKTSAMMGTSRLVNLLLDTLATAVRRSHDGDLVLQTLFSLFRLLHHGPSREAVCSNHALAEVLIAAVGWPHPLVRHYANSCLVRSNNAIALFVWQTFSLHSLSSDSNMVPFLFFTLRTILYFVLTPFLLFTQDIIIEFAPPAARIPLLTSRFESYNDQYMRFITAGGLNAASGEIELEDDDGYDYGYDDSRADSQDPYGHGHSGGAGYEDEVYEEDGAHHDGYYEDTVYTIKPGTSTSSSSSSSTKAASGRWG